MVVCACIDDVATATSSIQAPKFQPEETTERSPTRYDWYGLRAFDVPTKYMCAMNQKQSSRHRQGCGRRILERWVVEIKAWNIKLMLLLLKLMLQDLLSISL